MKIRLIKPNSVFVPSKIVSGLSIIAIALMPLTPAYAVDSVASASAVEAEDLQKVSQLLIEIEASQLRQKVVFSPIEFLFIYSEIASAEETARSPNCINNGFLMRVERCDAQTWSSQDFSLAANTALQRAGIERGTCPSQMTACSPIFGYQMVDGRRTLFCSRNSTATCARLSRRNPPDSGVEMLRRDLRACNASQASASDTTARPPNCEALTDIVGKQVRDVEQFCGTSPSGLTRACASASGAVARISRALAAPTSRPTPLPPAATPAPPGVALVAPPPLRSELPRAVPEPSVPPAALPRSQLTPAQPAVRPPDSARRASRPQRACEPADPSQRADVLYVGDSHSMRCFGAQIHERLTELRTPRGNVTVSRIASGGTGADSWAAGSGHVPPNGLRVTGPEIDTAGIRLSALAPAPASTQRIQPLRTLLCNTQARATVIQLGTNMLSPGANVSDNYIKQMIQTVHDAGSECFWIGPPQGAVSWMSLETQTSFNRALQRIVTENRCTYIDSMTSKSDRQNVLRDGYHYTCPGARAWGENVARELGPLVQSALVEQQDAAALPQRRTLTR